MNIRRPWLLVEAVLLAGPLTAYVVVCSLLAVGIGLPAFLFGETKPELIIPLTALLPGIFALGYLWFLTVRTAWGLVHSLHPAIDPGFLIASACGLFASATVIWLGDSWGTLSVLAGSVLLAHVLVIQRTLRRGAAIDTRDE